MRTTGEKKPRAEADAAVFEDVNTHTILDDVPAKTGGRSGAVLVASHSQ